jgi:hypothetical protein
MIPQDHTQHYLWQLLQEMRELSAHLGRIANYFDPHSRKQPDVTPAIKALEEKLDQIVIGGQRKGDTLKKEWYTPKEASEITSRYKAATIRQACNLGRIPEAKKVSRQWYIPHQAVERIANLGLPPP